ncbi:hypothetical protein KOR34_18010 [Posidoniimonas corsicana]|uniref:Uncharacterized protein n=1 Tax=Posidoniimonas corsicana TaxID=1938618 RepID=A0A5C5VE10_9BACT|nr:hypothetical protein [Posidoniimonas corsicana]TWT36856.1 hypothetical protein KOR34_18010 [Posidoniimonas corsicana]
MDDFDAFIELVNDVCRRPRMLTLNGTFGEVAALFTGIEIASQASSDGDIEKRAINDFITARLLVPSKLWWPGAVRMVAADDEEAIEKVRELLTEFANLRKSKSRKEVVEEAQLAASKYVEPEPAKVWRRFLAARYTANQAEIEPLIVPHPKANVFWERDATPADIAAQLNLMSDAYIVSVSSGSVESGHVTLITELGKFDAYLVDNAWRINAEPLIENDRKNREPGPQ